MTTRPGRSASAPDRDNAVPQPTRRAARKPKIQLVHVKKIRPEDGLSRKRDRDGHRELRKSIEQFGVLTPITVRPAPDDSDEYLLIKGQGRTLACQMLGIEKIPAIVVDEGFDDHDKVQQFLVENVARLRMRPMDRALLIARARQQGEETADVARRFGVTAATVRRLEAQLDGAGHHEVAALKQGTMNLALHAVIARHVGSEERGDVVGVIAKYSLRTKEIDGLFTALGWAEQVALGKNYRSERLRLLAWACTQLAGMKPGPIEERLAKLAEMLPLTLDEGTVHRSASAR